MVMNPELCILKSEVSGLVIICNVWNFEDDVKCFAGDPYYISNMYRDTCDLDLYFRYLWGKKFPIFFNHKKYNLDKELLSLIEPDDHTIGSVPSFYKQYRWDCLLARASPIAEMTTAHLAICADLGYLS